MRLPCYRARLGPVVEGGFARLTNAEDGEVFDSGMEAVLLPQGIPQRCKQVVIDIDGPLAVEADQMVVKMLSNQGVDVVPFSHVGLGDDIRIFQPLQDTVYRRIVNTDAPIQEHLSDFLAAVMAVSFRWRQQDIKDQPPLGGNPVALCPQPGDQVLRFEGHYNCLQQTYGAGVSVGITCQSIESRIVCSAGVAALMRSSGST